MKSPWLAALLSLFCLTGKAFATDTHPPSGIGPDFSLSLTSQPQGLFIPGDRVGFAFFPRHAEQITTDSFTLAFQLPPGLLLADSYWSLRGDTAYRVLPTPAGTTAYPVDITTRIDPKFRGNELTVRGHFADFPAEGQSVTFSVAEILTSQADTCLFFQDTTGNAITTITATRRKITARLRSPIDLSPTAPLRLSHNNCKALSLKPRKKPKNQKDKCTALRFVLADTVGVDYPPRYVPGPGKIKGILPFNSNGNKGDTLNISLKTIEGKPLADIVLTDENGEILDAQTDAPGYALTEVLTTTALHRTLHLRARRRLGIFPVKQYGLLDVERRPATVTLYRDNGPTLQQPNGDTTILLREVVANNDKLIRWKELSTRRLPRQTVFYRVLETVDKSGLRPNRRDTLSRDTCGGMYNVRLGAQRVKKQRWVAVDTLLYQATEATATVVGSRNLMGQTRGSLEVKIPVRLNVGDPDTRDSLVAFAYWIGVGENPINAYAALAEEVPPEWAQPGVSAPLAAYGLGHPVVLPGLPTSEALFQRNQLSFDFVAPRGKEAFAGRRAYTPLIRRDPNRPNFGFVGGATLRGLNGSVYRDPDMGKNVVRFYLAFANQHAVNTYTLQLKVVAYYQVVARQDAWESAATKP